MMFVVIALTVVLVLGFLEYLRSRRRYGNAGGPNGGDEPGGGFLDSWAEVTRGALLFRLLGLAVILVLCLQVVNARSNRQARADNTALRAEKTVLIQEADSLKKKYESYEFAQDLPVATKEEIRKHHEFVLGVFEKLSKFDSIIRDARVIEDKFEVVSCDVVFKIHDSVVKVEEIYDVKALEVVDRFHVRVGAKVGAESISEIHPWAECGSLSGRVVLNPEDIVQLEKTPTPSGTDFLISLNIPSMNRNETRRITFKYEWDWRHYDPASIAFYDPRSYGRVAKLGLHVALTEPLEYGLVPKYDPETGTFNLFRLPEPNEFVAYGPDNPEAEDIAGLWKDERGVEHGYNVYCVGRTNAKEPVAFVFRQSDKPVTVGALPVQSETSAAMR